MDDAILDAGDEQLNEIEERLIGALELVKLAAEEDTVTLIYRMGRVMEIQQARAKRLFELLEARMLKEYWAGFEAGWDEGWSHAF